MNNEPMRLTELEPQFIKRTDDTRFREVDSIAEADGVMFVCPACLRKNGNRRPGVHSIICWDPSVPQTTDPVPGRWNLIGNGYEDLTLQAGSSSILTDCWHGFIRNGEVTFT